ncbi:uncharacterized protein UHOD_11624 [Ustilago sp. UG-2017b]|nr:uncharacterized protein UHOD_11624 [Ustilago sp. UG-2017b]
MGLNAQEAGRPLVHMEGAQVSGDQTDRRGEAVDLTGTGSKCHGPECTGSMKAVGSYGRSTGTKGRVTEEDDHSRPRGGRAEARGLAGTGSRNGRSATSMESAVSMETMDTED